MEKISVVIVSWNVASSLQKCLSSVFATDYPHLEVWIIDNNSADNSVEVAKKFKRVKIVKNASNRGFPRGVNQGFKHSTGDYILLLNPDARIPKDFFAKALDFFKRYPMAATMGPKFTDPDGTPQGSVFPEPSVINTVREFWLGQKGLTDKFIPSQNWPVEVNCISGGCMMLPRRTLDKIGYFTEEIFMFYEDLDFCRRIRESGMKVFFNPDVEVVHEHGSSTKQSSQSQKYLWDASIWYNGWLKHYLMWFISWSGQKFRKYL